MEEDLKEKMLEEACLIVSSVDFIEREINKKLTEMQSAVDDNLYATAELLEKQIKHLLRKVNQENDNIDFFMGKWSKYIDGESKKLSVILKGKI
jgi:beta-xylosidase